MTLVCKTKSASRLGAISQVASALPHRFTEFVDSTKTIAPNDPFFPKVKFDYSEEPGLTATYLGFTLRFDMHLVVKAGNVVGGIVSCAQLAPLRLNEKPFVLGSFGFDAQGVTDIETDGALTEMEWCAGPAIARCFEMALERHPIG